MSGKRLRLGEGSSDHRQGRLGHGKHTCSWDLRRRRLPCPTFPHRSPWSNMSSIDVRLMNDLPWSESDTSSMTHLWWHGLLVTCRTTVWQATSPCRHVLWGCPRPPSPLSYAVETSRHHLPIIWFVSKDLLQYQLQLPSRKIQTIVLKGSKVIPPSKKSMHLS